MAKGKNEADENKSVLEMTLEELRAEKERLEVTMLRMTLGQLKAKQEQRQRDELNTAKSLDDYNKQVVAERSICRHKKGGKDLVGILAGDGIKGGYSVIQHTYPNGDTVVHCTRCAKAYFKPGCRMQKACERKMYDDQRRSAEEYKRQMAEYLEATSWPSDNSPSGSQNFLIQEVQTRSA